MISCEHPLETAAGALLLHAGTPSQASRRAPMAGMAFADCIGPDPGVWFRSKGVPVMVWSRGISSNGIPNLDHFGIETHSFGDPLKKSGDGTPKWTGSIIWYAQLAQGMHFPDQLTGHGSKLFSKLVVDDTGTNQ